MTGTDWEAWHRSYDAPDSALSRRLRVVQRHIVEFLDETAPRQARVISACAGDGRDVLEVLGCRGDSSRVQATLLEHDQRNVARAVRSVRAAGLDRVTVTCADASWSDAYVGSVPADLVLMCGVFGNISDEAVHFLVDALPRLCGRGATVIWTRHRRVPDLTGSIRRWMEEAGFVEVSFTAPDDAIYSVGRHRFVGEPQTLEAGVRLFEFVR